MNTKLMTSAGLLLLLAAAMTPSALGHDERGSFGTATGVSGRYVGSAGPAIADDAAPADTIAGGNMLCDMEVAGLGDMVYPQDEVTVDGYDGSIATPVAAMAPDSVDDGGNGGACHTNAYTFGDYNTPGCPSGDAFATDASSQVTWIGASCDYGTISGGTPESTILLGCVVNSVLTNQVTNIPGCVLAFVGCINTDCTVGGTFSCGADSSADAINFGHGSTGVAYPSVAASVCPASDATQAVFVWESAVTIDGAQHVHPATTGDVYTV